VEASVYDAGALSHKASDLFADPSLPLVIDVGCGYGATLLGLSHDQARQSPSSGQQRFNFLGCEMSLACVRFASGLAFRWGLKSNCAFVKVEALQCLEWINYSYEGPVTWILLQFPTPFAFSFSSQFLESKYDTKALLYFYDHNYFVLFKLVKVVVLKILCFLKMLKISWFPLSFLSLVGNYCVGVI